MAKNGNVAGEAQQNPNAKHVRSRSRFPELSHNLYHTDRFGEYTVDLLLDGVPTDRFPIHSVDTERSYTLGQPLMNVIHKRKELFMVPKMAILPFNWELIYTNPTQGSDVPADANSVLLNFASNFAAFWTSGAQAIVGALSGTINTAQGVSNFLTALLRHLIIGEYVYSAGSLLNVLGAKYSRQFVSQAYPRGFGSGAYDAMFDDMMIAMFQNVAIVTVSVPTSPTVQTTKYFLGLGTMPSNTVAYDGVSSFRALLQTFRENPGSVITSVVVAGTGTIDSIVGSVTAAIGRNYGSGEPGSTWRPMFSFALPVNGSQDIDPDDVTSFAPNNLNIGPLLAYQIICAHYYSRDNVDLVYSADLYRKYIRSLFISNLSGSSQLASLQQFTWNGISLPFDYLSGHLVSVLLYFNTSQVVCDMSYAFLTSTAVNNRSRLQAFSSIFGFRRSLRYLDYFTGSRVQPLAVGNTDVAVNSDVVSVVDITRNIQKQRFINAVNRTGRKIEDYTKGLFGIKPSQDFHDPIWCAVTEDVLYASETENTGEAQQTQENSITSNLKGSGRFQFDLSVANGYPCYILRLVSYDIRRAYTRTVQRHFLHVDRFDMFNPDFQFIGDQPVLGIELGQLTAPGYASTTSPMLTQTIPSIFGYQTRNEEFKTRYDEASGGFISALSSWIFSDAVDTRLSDANINSDFIRSFSTELDKYFVNLTGYSLGTYFHFIVKTENRIDASRPMVKSPNIL